MGRRLEKTANKVAQMASILPHSTLQAMKLQGSFQTELLSDEPHHLINVFFEVQFKSDIQDSLNTFSHF